MLFPFWASKCTPSPRLSSSSASLNGNSDKEEKQSSFLEPNIPHLFFPFPNMQTVYLESLVVQLLLYIIPNRRVCSHLWDCTVGELWDDFFHFSRSYLIQMQATFFIVWHNLIRMISSFRCRTNRHTTLPKRSTYWILLDSPITICYQKQHYSRARPTQPYFFGLTNTFQVGLPWTAGEQLHLWKLISCTLAQMNKFISLLAPWRLSIFWTFKVLSYALGEIFSQGHLISETEFLNVPS